MIKKSIQDRERSEIKLGVEKDAFIFEFDCFSVDPLFHIIECNEVFRLGGHLFHLPLPNSFGQPRPVF